MKNVVLSGIAGLAGAAAARYFEIPALYVFGGIAFLVIAQLGMKVDSLESDNEVLRRSVYEINKRLGL